MDINDIRIDDQNFDLAINLAAQAGVRVSREREFLYESANIKGFESFCDFCIEKKIKHIIYASSSSVYSDSSLGKFNEKSTLLKPKSKYGVSKLQNERHASEIIKSNDISMVGLRFFSVYGPFGRPDMAYYAFTKSIKEKCTIHLNNKGDMYRDMTYIDDIIAGILGAIDYVLSPVNKNKNELINLGNNAPIKISYLLHKIEKILGKKALVRDSQSFNESFKTHADITKAKNLLGYEPKVPFDEGIKKFLDWYRYYENR